MNIQEIAADSKQAPIDWKGVSYSDPSWPDKLGGCPCSCVGCNWNKLVGFVVETDTHSRSILCQEGKYQQAEAHRFTEVTELDQLPLSLTVAVLQVFASCLHHFCTIQRTDHHNTCWALPRNRAGWPNAKETLLTLKNASTKRFIPSKFLFHNPNCTAFIPYPKHNHTQGSDSEKVNRFLASGTYIHATLPHTPVPIYIYTNHIHYFYIRTHAYRHTDTMHCCFLIYT